MTDLAKVVAGSGMNLATVWETVAATVPDAPALIHDEMTRSWTEFEDRSARLAGALGAAGIAQDSKVALYMYNGPEYLEATFAAFKLRAATVNVNYRYLARRNSSTCSTTPTLKPSCSTPNSPNVSTASAARSNRSRHSSVSGPTRRTPARTGRSTTSRRFPPTRRHP